MCLVLYPHPHRHHLDSVAQSIDHPASFPSLVDSNSNLVRLFLVALACYQFEVYPTYPKFQQYQNLFYLPRHEACSVFDSCCKYICDITGEYIFSMCLFLGVLWAL